jgi:putative ABC transport system permease protein
LDGLTRLSLRSLAARPLRASLTTAGIALGVGVLFASLATNAGIEASAQQTVRDLIGRTDLRVSAFGETGLGPDTVAAIAATPGVAVAAPALERRTYLGSAASSGRLPPSVTVLGIDPDAEASLHDYVLSAGTALTHVGEPSALVTQRLADTDGLLVGSTLTILGTGEPAQYRVIGIVAGDGPPDVVDGRTVFVPLDTAQSVFNVVGVTRVDIGLAPGADTKAVIAALEAGLLVEPYVVSTPQDLADSLRASTADFQAMTAMIAAIALFTGAFLIFNTLSMTVIERIREVGLLRAAGATRVQVRSFILVQALVVGILGSVLGIAFGAVLAAAMVAYLGTIGSVTLDAPELPLLDAATAVAVGVLITLAAALEPARRAARISPVEALRARLDLPAARRARLRWLVVVFVAVALAGFLIWPRDAGAAGAVRAIAVYVVLLVATLLIPVLLPALARIGGLPFRLPLAFEERLARASLLRDRSRATLTIGALAVGLTMVVALGGVGQGARAAAGSWIADVVPGDVLVSSIRPIAADEGVAEDLDAITGVLRVSPLATFDLALDGVATDGAAMVGADLAADGRLTLAQGDRTTALAALDAGGAAIVPAAIAKRLGIRLDSTLTVATVDGSTMPLRVVGIAERTLPGRGGESVLVGWSDATAHFGVAGADAFAVRFAPNAPATVRDDLAETASLSALEVVTLDRIAGAIDDELDRVFGLFDALAVIAVVVAALGIANTLTMNVVERVREIGILRAAGMTTRQVWRSVVVEAGVVGLAGAIVGIVAGVLVGVLMVVLAGGTPELATSVPWPTVAVAVVLGVALSMLAAAYPARLAARVSIVRAVAYE